MARVLDAEAISAYRDDGFICPITMMSREEARHCRDQLESFEEEHGRVFSESREHAGESLTGSYRFKSHLLMKWLADIVHHPRILDVVEDLIGPDLLCWTTHWFIKEAGTPHYVSWHQDSNYWGLDTDCLVSVWLALSRSNADSGCVRVLPGSHTETSMIHIDTYQEHNMLTRGQEIRGIDEGAAVNLLVEPGEAAIFDYRLAHASYPNRSDDRRIGIGIRYIRPETRQKLRSWDSAMLVRGEDRYGHFELEPSPRCDFDPVTVEIHQRADVAQREVYYADAPSSA